MFALTMPSIPRTMYAGAMSLGIALLTAAHPGEAHAQDQSQPCTAGADPGPRDVLFFEHANYGGWCRKLTLPSNQRQVFYANVEWFGIPNDRVSSVKAGSQVGVQLFRDAHFGYSLLTIDLGWWYWNLGTETNDETTSFYIHDYPEDPNNIPGN